MSTPISNPTSYCTPAQAQVYIDYRQIGDLVDDLGVRISPAAILNHPNWQTILMAASGEVEAACLVGGRYSPTDLAALVGNSAVFLQRLVARLAYGELYARRYPDREVPPFVQQAWDILDKLRNGDLIFGTVEIQQAGILSAPQFVDVGDVQLLSLTSFMCSRYFGLRGPLQRIETSAGG